ncbi:hypothetical protein [Desmospora profundinema]|uniref:Uncharacterized protein n=1 Tax=Desmospora profundinema TaxID=1571184 RepID=A0ABU1IIZ4_9BACL|nr:hypothetical protein [Desmospora profundinema]MDR6224746.1 hypothetical protein [Desmospora profundinema]
MNFIENAKVYVNEEIFYLLKENDPSPVLSQWIDEVIDRMDQSGAVVFSIGRLRLSLKDSRKLAHSIAKALHAGFLRKECPLDLEVEMDQLQRTEVLSDLFFRTLFPHHDGGHCSYLTPSCLDDPEWHPDFRVFSSEGYTTTHAHKLYQGIFIVDPGEALSVTTYYNWLEIVKDAYVYQTGQKPQTAAEVAQWLGKNIRYSLEQQPIHQNRYLTLGAALGSKRLCYHGVSLHYAHADLSQQEYQRFPELREIVKTCPCQECLYPSDRMMCHSLFESLGVSWTRFRKTYEMWVPNEQFDFVVGHNLKFLHGGYIGGKKRVIEPICFVVDFPDTEGYENWLKNIWSKMEVSKHESWMA